MVATRGALIVFEGLDRSGKSTQCERLVAHLQQGGRDVSHMRFPNRGTAIGQMINTYLTGAGQTEDHVIHLLFSANRWESAAEIRRLIEQGTTVVLDRYYYSGCVYTAAKQIPGMALDWCRHPEVGLPRPDLCLFLDVSAETAMTRGGYGTERYEKKEMQDRVRELFGELRKHSDEASDIVVINANDSVDKVTHEVRIFLQKVMAEIDTKRLPLRTVQPWPADA